MESKKAWLDYTSDDEYAIERLMDSYKAFLTVSKTERRCVENLVLMAEAAGYRDLKEIVKNGETVKPGDRIYAVGMKKTIALFQIGTEPLEKGMNILGAHIDSPRIDVKQAPLYQDPYFKTEFAYFDTHYYGGIRKYQWLALPLALYGVIVKKDGTVMDVAIGDGDDDQVLFISDLLPHLAHKSENKPLSESFEGEKLDVLVGSRPLPGVEKEATKAQILKFFKDRYDVEEEDFLSAELELVPAGEARDAGLDRSMILGYGQDDRVCAYTSAAALFDLKESRRTSVCLLTDKEEIGSVGATGAQSMFFENAVAEILAAMGNDSNLAVRRALSGSRMLSSDVSAAFDPLFSSSFETLCPPRNSAYFGRGICFNKFTGSRGKSGSNDANAEYMAAMRKIMDDNGVRYQTAELGKVDEGGVGTIAFISAKYGMEVIDSGVPVLSMHAPWETCSKSDIFEAYKAYKAFLKDA